MEEWREGSKGGKINGGFSWDHNLGKRTQPEADNMIISGEEKKNQNKEPHLTALCKGRCKRRLVFPAALIQQYLLDAMLVFYFYLCHQLKKY